MRAAAALAGGLLLLFAHATVVAAHAEPERANPPISGTVAAVPAVVEIWFDEEVNADGTTVRVIGPGGVEAHAGAAELDLFDPNRQRVTVPLASGLGPGTYTVQWVSLSATDGDEARGGYVFTVAAATPAATVATPAVETPTAAAAPAPTPVPEVQIGTDDFDSRAFAISVGVGLVAAVGIFLCWRLVRPKNPRFRG